MMIKIKIENIEEMRQLAQKIAKNLTGDEVFILEGELASGKTTLTSFLAKSLKISDNVNSPSFTIFKRYEGKKYNLNHFDFYRLNKEGLDFDLEEYYQDGITVIEWASNVKTLIPYENLTINITRVDENEREIVFIPSGIKYEKLIKCIV